MPKAIIIDKPNKISLVDRNLSTLSEGEILIKVIASGICGTDLHILRGTYMAKYPIIPGHEFSGIIEEVGSKISRFKIGDHVAIEPNISCDNCYNCLNNRQNFCQNWEAIGVTRDGGMSQYVIVPEKAVFLTEHLPFECSAFMEPLSCVIHGIEKANIQIGDRVLLLGAGPIGLLFLQLTQLKGAVSVSVVEKQNSRAKLAEQYGAEYVNKSIGELKKDEYDIVIEATGEISLMEQTIELVRFGGKVLLFGVPPAKETMKLEGIKIFKKGLTILSSFTSVRNSYQALALLKAKKIDVTGLVSHRLPLSEFERGVKLLEKNKEDVDKVLIMPQE